MWKELFNKKTTNSQKSQKNSQQTLSPTQKTGVYGEELARSFLKKNGFVMIAQNFRFKGGEIDLIAHDHQEIYFIEVKTRKTPLYGSGLEAVTATKQMRFSRAVQLYLLKNPKYHKLPKNLSVIQVDLSQEEPNITFIPRAFELWGDG